MRGISITLVCAIAVLAACGGKPKPEEPTPVSEPAAPTPAPTRPAPDDRNTSAAADRARAAAVLGETIYFEYDRADIGPAARATLDAKAAVLRSADMRLTITGHADERGADEYNLALGMRRATAAQRYLLQAGVPVGRLSVVSYGEERPASPGHDERAYAANRRAEFVVGLGG
jgi:peptidoglycan-associated lipoprotein